MKKIVVFLLTLPPLSSGIAQTTQEFRDDKVKVVYETKMGRIHGKYASWYANGKKKSEGSVENNYRAGIWTAWDSTGRMRMQREYLNPFAFRLRFPETAGDNAIRLLNVPLYMPAYNAENYLDYFYVSERAAFCSKRIWREIFPGNNAVLFERGRLFQMLTRIINAHEIPGYQDETYSDEIRNTIDTSMYSIISFRVSEEFLFDVDRFVSETRIMGICPVTVNKQTEDTTELFWIYFPEARKYLAQLNIADGRLPEKIKSADDLFFYRCFSGKIYKEGSLYGNNFSGYNKDKISGVEAERIELNLWETEHDIWISLTE